MNVEIKNCPIEIANDIWNAAIEEAAKVAQFHKIGLVDVAIRKLKKPVSVGISKELDQAITDELNNPPKDIVK